MNKNTDTKTIIIPASNLIMIALKILAAIEFFILLLILSAMHITSIENLLGTIAGLSLFFVLPLLFLYLQARPVHLHIQESHEVLLKISHRKKELEIMKGQRFLLLYQSTSKSTSLKIRNIDTTSTNNEIHFATPFPKKDLLKKIFKENLESLHCKEINMDEMDKNVLLVFKYA